MRSKAAIQSHPIHPMLVAFPIGLFVTSFIFDLIGTYGDHGSVSAAAWYCVIAGLCFSVLAAIPGVIDLFSVVPPQSSGRTRGYRHAVLNLLVVAVFIAVAVYRRGPAVQADGVSLILSAAGVVLLGFSGWLGATLVYRNQIGVDHRYANSTKWKTAEVARWDDPVCSEDDLKDGQLMLAEIAGTRIAVGRCAEGLVAFSDHCTHKGGPLSDGALVGCTVQCPWHGSQFNVHTGRVVNGPAEEHIEAYDVSVANGSVYVRPKHRTERGSDAA
jgi:uncharacterized membrane protein/nitrite reductase/ring-hydroxylating ferredoxin subunit